MWERMSLKVLLEEQGADSPEYALLLLFIVLLMAGIGQFGNLLRNLYAEVADCAQHGHGNRHHYGWCK